MNRLCVILAFLLVTLLTTAMYHICNPQWILFRKGEAYFHNEEYSKAIFCYERLRDLNFNNPDFLRHLGIAYSATGNPDKAVSAYEALLACCPEAQHDVLVLASLYAEQDNVDRALDLLKTLTDTGSVTRLATIYRARILAKSGRFEEAIHEYRKALGEEP